MTWVTCHMTITDSISYAVTGFLTHSTGSGGWVGGLVVRWSCGWLGRASWGGVGVSPAVLRVAGGGAGRVGVWGLGWGCCGRILVTLATKDGLLLG